MRWELSGWVWWHLTAGAPYWPAWSFRAARGSHPTGWLAALWERETEQQAPALAGICALGSFWELIPSSASKGSRGLCGFSLSQPVGLLGEPGLGVLYRLRWARSRELGSDRRD